MMVVREWVRKEWIVHLTMHIAKHGLEQSERVSECEICMPSEWVREERIVERVCE